MKIKPNAKPGRLSKEEMRETGVIKAPKIAEGNKFQVILSNCPTKTW